MHHRDSQSGYDQFQIIRCHLNYCHQLAETYEALWVATSDFNLITAILDPFICYWQHLATNTCWMVLCAYAWVLIKKSKPVEFWDMAHKILFVAHNIFWSIVLKFSIFMYEHFKLVASSFLILSSSTPSTFLILLASANGKTRLCKF